MACERRDKQWLDQILKSLPRHDVCDRCGGPMHHTRLKGYRCPRCD